jgi:pimeloyl-ACP methyl ester carboxylesterase
MAISMPRLPRDASALLGLVSALGLGAADFMARFSARALGAPLPRRLSASLSHKPLNVAWTDLGQGEPVMLLHGIPTWSFLYNEVIPLLARHSRVIAPDFLGHGYSDRRDFFDRSLSAQTDMIIRLMDHLDIARADFVGHDTGGGVALIMAIHDPERVARLVLTNVVAYDPWPIDDMIALGNPNWRSKSPREVADFLASGLPHGIFNKDRLTPEFEAGIMHRNGSPTIRLRYSSSRCAASLRAVRECRAP